PLVTGFQTCALPIWRRVHGARRAHAPRAPDARPVDRGQPWAEHRARRAGLRRPAGRALPGPHRLRPLAAVRAAGRLQRHPPRVPRRRGAGVTTTGAISRPRPGRDAEPRLADYETERATF